MRASDPVAFLFGSRGAIERMAGTRGVLWLGALLVLTATVARNYDQEDMIANWPVWLHGFGASVVNSMVMWSVVYASAREKALGPGYLGGYVVFLGLFWMTSPLAWLYAVPYERFMDPVGAVEANANTLTVVAGWRVLLITRVLAVMWGGGFVRLLLVVLGISNVVLLVVIHSSPTPIVDLMGGMHQSPAVAKLASINFAVGILAMLTAPVLVIAALIASAKLRGKWDLRILSERIPAAVWSMLVIVGFGCVTLFVVFQPQQRLRVRVEDLIRADTEAGLVELSKHERSGFPVGWDPPPRDGWPDAEPTIPAVRAALAKGGQSVWVRRVYLAKSWRALMQWHEMGDMTFVEEMNIAGRRPSEEECEAIQFHVDHDETLDAKGVESLKSILALPVGVERDPG